MNIINHAKPKVTVPIMLSWEGMSKLLEVKSGCYNVDKISYTDRRAFISELVPEPISSFIAGSVLEIEVLTIVDEMKRRLCKPKIEYNNCKISEEHLHKFFTAFFNSVFPTNLLGPANTVILEPPSHVTFKPSGSGIRPLVINCAQQEVLEIKLADEKSFDFNQCCLRFPSLCCWVETSFKSVAIVMGFVASVDRSRWVPVWASGSNVAAATTKLEMRGAARKIDLSRQAVKMMIVMSEQLYTMKKGVPQGFMLSSRLAHVSSFYTLILSNGFHLLINIVEF
uniref:Reverse transcriptase domain-containing protein n=1 Tax=Heterorhabditis bacteriophora TaxID=37862 RepID=A0A1I7XHR3_HETBA